MKNKKGLIAFLIIGFILIIAGVLLIFLLPKKSSKEMYVDAIGKSLGFISNDEDGIENIVKEFKNKIEKKNYKLTINSETIQDEAGHETSEEEIYIGNNKVYISEKSTANDLSIFMEAMLKDNKLYFGIKDYLENVYYIDKIDELLKETDDNSEMYNKITDYLVDSILESINNKDVVNESKEITINGTTYKSTLYGYTFTGETVYDVIVNFTKKLKNDKDFCETIANLAKNGGTALSKDDVAIMLDQVVASAEQLKSAGKIMTYNVYTYKDDTISAQLIIYSGETPMTIGYHNVVNNGKTYFKAFVSAMGTEVVKLEINEKVKNNCEISASMMNQDVITGYLKNEDGNYELKLNGVGDAEDSYILLNINKDHTGTLTIVSTTQKVNVSYKYEEVDEIPEMDVKNSKPYEEATEMDKMILESILGEFFPSGTKDYVYSDYGFEGLDM